MAINLIRKANAEMPSTAFNPLTEQWVIGPNAGGVDHFVQGSGLYLRNASGASQATQLAFLPGAAEAGGSYSFIQTSDGTTDLYGLGINNEGNHLIIGARSSNSRNIFFVTGTPTRIQTGKIDSTGTWTIGTTVNANVHEVRSNTIGNDMFVVRNYSTSTSADVRAGLQIVKGSTTTTAGAQRFIRCLINAGGTDMGYLSTNGAAAIALFNASDRRLKKDIEPMTGALAKIAALNPVTFKWKSGDEPATGFIAQEIHEVLPQFVSPSDDGSGENLPEGQEPWHMTESGMTAYLVAAIKELKEEFDAYVAAHP